MQFRAFLAAGVGLLTCLSAAVAQPPGIDGLRWTTAGGVALTQTQGTAQGAPMRLTWGFADDGTSIPSFGAGSTANSNLIARLDFMYGAGPGGADLTQRPWFAQFQSVFNRWSSISGLSYQYEANDDGVAYSNTNSATTRGLLGTRADVRIGGRAIDGNSGILAFNFFPTVGDMVIDTNDNFFSNATGTANSFRGLRNVLAHEHGHGLGMDHVEANTASNSHLMEPFVDNAFDGPQYHDILVAQRAYGDVGEKSSAGLGNDVAARASALGAIAGGGSVSIGNSARNIAVGPNDVDFFSIDDNTDTDFWSFSVSTPGSVNILLEALGFNYTAGPQDNIANNEAAFDSRLRSNLALALFDSTGTNLLASSDVNGLGGNESINAFSLAAAGTYMIRVTGVDNADAISLDTQFYGLTASFTAIPEPGVCGMLLLASFGLAGIRRRRTV